MVGPEFAHDELRRYALARLLLVDGDPTSKLLEAGAPRWSLAAARLASQAWLARPRTATAPLWGRFAVLQASFDALIEAGHGARWGDVPGEALLTLADPGALLRDAWPELRTDDNAGLRQLARLVDQRLRDSDGIINLAAVEPIITLFLEDDAPWRSGEFAQDLLREWLRAHVVSNSAAGHPLRVLLRERFVRACAAADRRLAEEQEAEAAARAARTPEEVEEERRVAESNNALLAAAGYRARRERPEVPYEITNKIALELIALLGSDLGNDGEAILRRVARDAPWWLAPAVEELFTGLALASCQRGLLAHLTEAYYLDDEDDGSRFLDDGVRHHDARSAALVPQAAWYRGPFMPLFQTDFRNGVAVLNRLLNHAARIRARTLARLDQTGPPLDDEAVGPYQIDLEITGASRPYVGDEHVWIWYRGTGVGPFPCISALQALERECDRLINAGVPIRTLVSILLDGCENLAMVGLVVGVLVRHLEDSDRLLDPYLTEPLIWRHEFKRVAEERSGLAASSEGLTALERRNWSLREAAGIMVLRGDVERAAELHVLGERLVANARRHIESTRGTEAAAAQHDAEETIEAELAKVRAWAISLDRDKYQAREAPDGLYVQVTPPDDVVEALQSSTEDLQRAQEDVRLFVRYHVKPKEVRAEDISPGELAADVAAARELLENPPSLNAYRRWDTPATVAASALEAHLLRGVKLPIGALTFAADTVLRIGEGDGRPLHDESELSYFERGADRSAARAVPLLLLPVAAPLRGTLDIAHGHTIRRAGWRRRAVLRRATVDDIGGRTTLGRARTAGTSLARADVYEVRLHLARGLDHLWESRCVADGTCHHEVGMLLAEETMRGCVLGAWDPKTGGRRAVTLDEPVTESLAKVAGNSLHVFRLDAATRALAPAATANICVSTRARVLLMALLAAQSRSLLSNGREDMDPRGTHSIVSARALLTLAEDGGDVAIEMQVAACANNSALLANFLRAFSAAAEETADRAATARRIWPSVVRRVLDLNDAAHTPFEDHHYGDMALAALIPNAANEVSYLYSEVQDKPIAWWDPLSLRPEVEAWLEVAAGNPICVDQLVIFLGTLTPEDQVRTGLPWVATLVLADPVRVASRSYMLPGWLIEMRSVADDAGIAALWQQVVDALVVAGVRRLAPYSE